MLEKCYHKKVRKKFYVGLLCWQGCQNFRDWASARRQVGGCTVHRQEKINMKNMQNFEWP